MNRGLDEQKADDYLSPVRAWVRGNHGGVTKIAEELTERTGKEVHRQTVGRWLAKTPEHRNQPNLGFGLLIVEAYEKLATEEDSEDSKAAEAAEV